MVFRELITRMTQAACKGDGKAVADCFTPDGIYEDVFYGEFQGPSIATMITDYFHRDATRFKWDLHQIVGNEQTGMARYIFSFDSKLEGSEGRRAVFEGVAICRLLDGRIARYSEVADTLTGQNLIGFSEAKMARYIDRQTKALTQRVEVLSHITP